MRFTWTGVLLAPLLVPVLFSATAAGFGGGDHPAFGFLALLVPCCVISYGVMVFLFLPSLFVLSVCRRVTGWSVALLGLGLGVVAFVLTTAIAWSGSGPDSGPPDESFLEFVRHWAADPLTPVEPSAGLLTAGAYWRLGTWRLGQTKPAR